MRKGFLKKACATALAAMMTVASTVSVFAADEVTFNEVTYKFECTTFVGNDTIELDAQALSWSGLTAKPTKEVTAAGTFEMKVTFANGETGFQNVGYLKSANGVDNIYKLTGIVINGVEFTFQADATAMDGDTCKDAVYQTSTINANDGTLNGFPNVWNKAGQQAVVAKSANGSTINGASSGMTITWAAADLAPETTTEAPAKDPSPTTGDTNVLMVFLAVAAVSAAVAVASKKMTVNE